MKELRNYGMKPLARFSLGDQCFVIDIDDEALATQEKCIYAFAIADEIVRIGSSKGVLSKRMRAWQRDVSKAIRREKSATPFWEADEWVRRLKVHRSGQVWARRGTDVTTPVGTFPAYMDEESVLIGRHLPPLNRSKHR
jgi:hypothetical protein